MAWGKPASERVKKIDTKKHLRLESVHPSPLSAARGFFDCAHFLKANDWITTRYGIEEVIDWDCLADNRDQEVVQKTKVVPPTPGKEDEIGQIKKGDGVPIHGQTGAPAFETEESFKISAEEEALMAEAQVQADSELNNDNTQRKDAENGSNDDKDKL